MTISEAFDEVVLSSEEGMQQVHAILDVLGCQVPDDGTGPDTAFIRDEIKVIVGVLMLGNKSSDPSYDAKKALRDGLARIFAGKPLDGVPEAAMDADISGNLDLL